MQKITKPFATTTVAASLNKADWMPSFGIDSDFKENRLGVDSLLQEMLLDVDIYTLHEFLQDGLYF